jgi:hypothetical protein
MPSPIAILTHTPLWVFGVLAILIVFGIRGLHERTLSLSRLLIVPAVFIAWGGASLAMRASTAPVLLAAWLATASIGFGVGWLTTRLGGVVIDRAGGRVHLPGSPVPLVRNVSIFLVKYAFGVASAIAPGLVASLAPWDVGVSGLATGYFLGWLARFALKYRGETSAISPRNAF